MRTFAKHIMMAAAATLAAAPAVAAPAGANPAASLSVTQQSRAATASNGDSQLAGGISTSTLTFGLIGAIIILGVVLAITLSDNGSPNSP